MSIFDANVTYLFDFSERFVTVNGRALDRVGLCYVIGWIDFHVGTTVYTKTYRAMALALQELLLSNDFINVTVKVKS